MIVIARATGNPLALGKMIENAIHDLDAELVVFDVITLELREQIASFGQRVVGTFVGALGLLALVLAAVGIYGVTAYCIKHNGMGLTQSRKMTKSTTNVRPNRSSITESANSLFNPR
jgi:hypothetical protein